MRVFLPLAISVFAAVSFGQSTLAEYQAAVRANPNSSQAHYGIAGIYLQRGSYQSAANEFRRALAGDLQPRWTEVWSHIGLGKLYDATAQRDRAVEQYQLAIKTNDDTRGALEEARKYLQTPYKP